MKRPLIIALMLLLVLSVSAQEKRPAAQPKPKPAAAATKPADRKAMLKTMRDKLTYLVAYDSGLRMVADVQAKRLDLDSKVFVAALTDAVEGKAPALTDAEAKAVMQLFDRLMKATPEEREKMQRELFNMK